MKSLPIVAVVCIALTIAKSPSMQDLDKGFKETIIKDTKEEIKKKADFKSLEVHTLANSGFLKNFLYQGGVRSTVFWVFEDLKFKISEGYNQFWSKPSEILNSRSSTTPETVAFTPP